MSWRQQGFSLCETFRENPVSDGRSTCWLRVKQLITPEYRSGFLVMASPIKWRPFLCWRVSSRSLVPARMPASEVAWDFIGCEDALASVARRCQSGQFAVSRQRDDRHGKFWMGCDSLGAGKRFWRPGRMYRPGYGSRPLGQSPTFRR